MRALITGGTGFIGSRLALRCQQEGLRVRVLGLENTTAEGENRREIESSGVEIVYGSILERERVRTALQDVDTVFHLAAAQHEMNVPDERFWEVNVRGTRELLEESRRAAVRRVVHASTIGVYGDAEGLLDEDSPCKPDNIYGRTKLEAERLALSFEGLEIVVVRIPETYGPGDRRLLKLFRAVGKKRFLLIGDGANQHHPIYITDLVEALMAAGRAPEAAGHMILLGGAETVTTRQMVEAVAGALGKAPPRLRAPLWLFAGAAAVLERTLRPLGIQPPLHRRRLDFFRKSCRLSTLRAQRLLGVSAQVGFAEGARRTAGWYQERGLL